MKPRIFIGSSSESKHVAQAIFEHLEETCEPVLWFHDIFSLSQSNMASLERATKEHDFAVFVFGDDDERRIRGVTDTIARDNVVFEAGLFIGAIGSSRVFIIQSDKFDFSLPTDFLGWNTGYYSSRDDGNMLSATATACRKVKASIEREGAVGNFGGPQYAGSICYRLNEGVLEYLLIETTHKNRIFPKGLVLPSESSEVAALRFAEDEGGVLGRIQSSGSLKKKHWKASRSEEQELELHIVSARGYKDVSEKFRDPKWFRYDDAMQALSIGRTAKYAEEFRSALAWAKNEIENKNSIVHRLAGIVPYRKGEDGSTEILLITSQTSRNWIIPQGHIEAGESAVISAQREASEEAGVEGNVKATPIGVYHFEKRGIRHEVMVFPMLVSKTLENWPERESRTRNWFSLKDTYDIIFHDGLKKVIETFDESIAG